MRNKTTCQEGVGFEVGGRVEDYGNRARVANMQTPMFIFRAQGSSETNLNFAGMDIVATTEFLYIDKN